MQSSHFGLRFWGRPCWHPIRTILETDKSVLFDGFTQLVFLSLSLCIPGLCLDGFCHTVDTNFACQILSRLDASEIDTEQKTNPLQLHRFVFLIMVGNNLLDATRRTPTFSINSASCSWKNEEHHLGKVPLMIRNKTKVSTLIIFCRFCLVVKNNKWKSPESESDQENVTDFTNSFRSLNQSSYLYVRLPT